MMMVRAGGGYRESPCELGGRVVVFSHDTLQGHSPALGVSQMVRGEDLSPGVAGHALPVRPESQGRQAPQVVVVRLGDDEVDQAGCWCSGVELTLVLTLVTPLHLGYLEVVVRGAEAVHQGHPGGGGEHGASRGQDGQLGQPQPGDGGGAEVVDPAAQHHRAPHHRRQVGLARGLDGRGRGRQVGQSVVERENSDHLAQVCSYQAVLVLVSLLVIVEDGGCQSQAVKCEAQSEQHH